MAVFALKWLEDEERAAENLRDDIDPPSMHDERVVRQLVDIFRARLSLLETLVRVHEEDVGAWGFPPGKRGRWRTIWRPQS